MKIEILGTGCKKCNDLYDVVKVAVQELALDAEVIKESDLKKIMSYKVIATPALVIDGVVKVSGKLPTLNQIKTLLAD